jgi:hypothetical protein
MRTSRPVGFVLAAMTACSGCSVIPSFDTVAGAGPGPSEMGLTIDDVVRHIQCEILDVQEGKGITDTEDLNQVAKFKSNSYVAYINLTLDITNNQALTPGLNFINPAATFIGVANFGLSGTQHRNVNPAFTLDLSPLEDSAFTSRCAQDNESMFGIKGNLGIQEIILAGMRKSTPKDFGFGLISSLPGGEPAPTGDAAKVFAAPTFGSTVDFTITGTLSGGPTWTFKTFKGPGGGSNGLANVGQSEKDTLLISFAAASPNAPSPKLPPPSAAAPEAQQLFEARESLRKVQPTPAGLTSKIAAAAAAQNAATQSLRINLTRIFQATPLIP